MILPFRNLTKGISNNGFRLVLRLRAPVTFGARFFTDDAPANTPKLIYPQAPSKEHSDLPSFLAYVERTRLNKKSTVYRGTHYEYTVAEALSPYGFFLKRVGGSSDRGVDLLGTWTLPSTDRVMRVIVQCKAGARSPGPAYVRELKGAVKEAPPDWRGPDVLGLLVGEKPATKGIQEELNTAAPLGYICCSKNGVILQLLWNHQAEEIGLEGISIGVQHAEDTQAKRLVLLQNGKVLPWLGKELSQSDERASDD